MDDKKKHRLVGLAVIIILFLIITPILIKNSRRHLSHKYVKQQLHPAIQKIQTILKTPKMAQLPLMVKESETVKTSSIEAIPHSVSENGVTVSPSEKDTQPYSVAKQHSIVLQHAMAKQQALQMQHKHVVLLKPEKARALKPIPKRIALKPKTTPLPKHKAILHSPTSHAQAAGRGEGKQFVPHFMSEKSFASHKNKLKTPSVVKVNASIKTKSSQYWVQVASLSNVKNAQKLVERLRIKGFKVYLKNITAATGETLVKVMVVNSSGIEQAQVLRHKLAKEMKLNGVIVIA